MPASYCLPSYFLTESTTALVLARLEILPLRLHLRVQLQLRIALGILEPIFWKYGIKSVNSNAFTPLL